MGMNTFDVLGGAGFKASAAGVAVDAALDDEDIVSGGKNCDAGE